MRIWLCWGLTTHQPLWVILCRLPETGRKEIEEIVEEMKERTGKKEEQEWKWRNRRNKICLCWGFTAQSTQWGHVERGQFT